MSVFLFDQGLQLFDIIPTNEVIESEQVAERNGLITHTVECYYRVSADLCAYFGMRDPIETDNFWLYKVTSREKEGHTILLDGVYKLFDDLKSRGYIKDKRPQNQSIAHCMGFILEDTGWTVGQYSVQNTASSSFYYQSKLDGFWQAIELYGCEFKPKMTFADGKITSQTIDFAPSFDEDNGRIYVYGDRLLTVKAQTSDAEVFTAFVGLGRGEESVDENGEATGGFGRKIKFSDIEWKKSKGDPIDKPLGQEWLEIKEATDLFGYADGTPRTGFYVNESIEDPEELLKETYNYALTHCRPMTQFEASIEEGERISLYEVVGIKNPKLGISYKTKVFKNTRSFLNPSKQKIEFGEQIIKSRARQTVESEKAQKIKEEAQGSRMDAITDALNKQWRNDDGYNYELKRGNPYGLPAGYYSFDKPIDQDPQEVIGISAGKLVISNKKTSTGEWIFRTFGTGDGFTADLIQSGTLLADLVSTGVLKSQNGQVVFDLDNESFAMGDQLTYSPEDGLKLKIVDEAIEDIEEDLSKKADKDKIVTQINANPEGVQIAGENIELTGDTTVQGSFSVPGSALFGTINADYVNVKNLNADYITSGTLRRGVDNGSCTLPVYGSASLSGSATSIDTGNRAFVFDYGRNTFEVNGRIAANPGNNRHGFDIGGVFCQAHGLYFEIKPWTGYINFNCQGADLRIPTSVYVDALYIGGKKVTP